MSFLEQIRERVQSGQIAEAMASADQLARARDVASAASAYWTIAEADPREGARCFGMAADLYADAGRFDAAYQAYEAAGRCGAPPQWVAERVGRLQSLVYDAFASSGGREAGFASHQPGTVVVRPQWMAFIPTGSMAGLVDIAARVAIGAAGFQVFRFPGDMSPQQAATHLALRLSTWTVSQLDQHVPRIAIEAAGVSWTPSEAFLVEQKKPLGTRLYFEGGRERVDIGRASVALQDPRFVRLRRFWAGRSA